MHFTTVIKHHDRVLIQGVYIVLQEAKLHVKSFKELFARFLEDTGPSVEWEKIKPPPEGSVRNPYKNDNIIFRLVRSRLGLNVVPTTNNNNYNQSILIVRDHNTFLGKCPPTPPLSQH